MGQKQINKISKSLIELGLGNSERKKKINVFVFDELDSTNQWVSEHIAERGDQSLLCIAESQTLGRGRSGREWSSPAGSNIYMSFSCRPDTERKNIAAISLLIGLALIRVLKAKGLNDVALKWPNDVLVRGKKLAGILIESKRCAEHLILIIGVGVNVKMPIGFKIESEMGWSDLSSIDATPADRNALIVQFYLECEKVMRQFFEQGFSVFKQEWMSYDGFAGRDVKIIDQGELQYCGMNMGIDDSGCLLVRSDEGVKKIFSGDVSLRINNED